MAYKFCARHRVKSDMNQPQASKPKRLRPTVWSRLPHGSVWYWQDCNLNVASDKAYVPQTLGFRRLSIRTSQTQAFQNKTRSRVQISYTTPPSRKYWLTDDNKNNNRIQNIQVINGDKINFKQFSIYLVFKFLQAYVKRIQTFSSYEEFKRDFQPL